MKNIFTLLTFIILLLLSEGSKATKTTVNSLTTLTTTYSNARAGDTIVVANGIYSWGQIVLTNNANTSTSNWIVVMAQTRSGVTFKDSTYIKFSGTRIRIDGFRFANGSCSTNAVVSFRSSTSVLANYCRVSNITFDNYNSIDSVENEWVGLFGTNNRLDHCTFINKSNARATVVVWYSTATFPVQSISTYHRIDSNYFAGRSYMGGNGGETIRVGVGNNSRTYGYNIVEYNLFEGCIQTEPEIVSNKSCYNTYRYNTFKNCNGGLTLRMGKYCTVYGNFFINNDPTKTDSYGVRIIDKGHKVFNNYFEGLLGSNGSLTAMRTPIIVYNGSFSAADSLNPLVLNGAYLPADSAVIAFNTIVNCNGGSGIKIGHRDNGINIYQPKGLKVSNNVIKMSTGQAVYIDPLNTSLTYSAEGNIYNAPNGLGITSITGFVSNTLTFGSRANGILGAPSIVQDAAVNTVNYSSMISSLDAQGQTRSTIFDAGCDELNATGTIMNYPLDSNLVGSGKPLIILVNQTISFAALPSKTVGNADFAPGATATSGLVVSYASSNTAVATIVSGNIHIVGSGTVVITASQAGNAFYNAAPNVAQNLSVSGTSQTITFAVLPAKIVGDVDFAVGATTTSGLTITYTSSNTAVATIINSNIHIVGAGIAVITASQLGNTIYNAAANVNQTLTVTKSYIYSPSSATILFGTVNSSTFGNLATNNSSYYVVNSTTTGTRKIDWYGSVIITQPPITVSKLTINYDGKNSALKTQILYLYNWSTAAWVQIDSRTVTTTDITITNTQTAPANYISTTGEIRLRVYSSAGTANYTCSGDWLQFTVQSTSAAKPSGNSTIPSNDYVDEVSLFPNPVKGETNLQYNLKEDSRVSIAVYNSIGKFVKSVLINENQLSGMQTKNIQTLGLANGIYFIKMNINNHSQSLKFIINR